MNLGAEFIKRVNVTCTQALIDIGMKKRMLGMATMELSADFTGWVGLNTATRRGDGNMYVNPRVGVRHDPASKLECLIKGRKWTPGEVPTIGAGLGYIMPEKTHIPWVFPLGEPVEPIANDLAEKIRMYGFRYMNEHANLTKMIEAIRTTVTLDYRGPRWLTVAYYAGASGNELRDVVEACRAQLAYADRRDDDFVVFTERFLDHISRQDAVPGAGPASSPKKPRKKSTRG